MNNQEQNKFSGSAVRRVGKIVMAGMLCLAMMFTVSVVSVPDASAACHSKTSCAGKTCNNSSVGNCKTNKWLFGNNCGFAGNQGFVIDENGNLCFNGFCFGKVDVNNCPGSNCQNNGNKPQQPGDNTGDADDNVGDNDNNNNDNIDNDNSGDNDNDNKDDVNDNTGSQKPGDNNQGNTGNQKPGDNNQGNTGNQKPGNNNQGNTGSTVSQYEREVVSLCNEIRASYGLSPLTINEKLCQLAEMKSQDMADRNYFDHQSPTYGSPFDMLKSHGVSYRSAGENIAKGYSTPQAVVDAWMKSEGHRANILNSTYAEIGVGYVTDGNHWTQLFLKQ